MHATRDPGGTLVEPVPACEHLVQTRIPSCGRAPDIVQHTDSPAAKSEHWWAPTRARGQGPGPVVTSTTEEQATQSAGVGELCGYGTKGYRQGRAPNLVVNGAAGAAAHERAERARSQTLLVRLGRRF